MCSCRGPSACKQGRRLYKRCSCKQWLCTYTAPCVARTCWEESQTHIAAPLWQRRSTHPAGGDHTQISSTTPRRSTGNRTPRTTRTPTIRPPGGIPDTRSTHTHTAQIRHPAAHAGSCAAPAAPHDQAPRQHESPPDYQAGQAFSFARWNRTPPGGNDWEEPHSQTAARIARCIHIPPGSSSIEQSGREPPARPQPSTQQERARTGSRPQTPPGVATTTPTIRPPTHQQPDRYMLHPSL